MEGRYCSFTADKGWKGVDSRVDRFPHISTLWKTHIWAMSLCPCLASSLSTNTSNRHIRVQLSTSDNITHAVKSLRRDPSQHLLPAPPLSLLTTSHYRYLTQNPSETSWSCLHNQTKELSGYAHSGTRRVHCMKGHLRGWLESKMLEMMSHFSQKGSVDRFGDDCEPELWMLQKSAYIGLWMMVERQGSESSR